MITESVIGWSCAEIDRLAGTDLMRGLELFSDRGNSRLRGGRLGRFRLRLNRWLFSLRRWLTCRFGWCGCWLDLRPRARRPG